MNNIPKKNVILENEKNNGFPYGAPGCVEYVSDQNINAAVLDNTFRQLVDNDLYAENYIRNYSSQVVGPKTSAPSVVYSAPNGYKAYSDDGIKMRIYRKQDNPLSASVSCALSSVSANFVAQVGSYVIAGCDDGIYYEQDSFKRLSGDIPAYGYWFDDQVRLVASHDGVYSLVMKTGFDISQYHLFIRLNRNDIGRCNAVAYVKDTGTVVIGTDTGIYEGECSIYDMQNAAASCTVDFSRMKMLAAGSETSSRVNGITLSSSAALAATDNGMFQPDVDYDFTGFGTELSGKNIRFQLEYGGGWLIAADDGIYVTALDYSQPPRKELDIRQAVAAVSAASCAYIVTRSAAYKYASGETQLLDVGLDGMSCAALYSSRGAEFPLIAAGDRVYYINTDGTASQLVQVSGAYVNDIYVDGDSLTLGTTGGLYRYELALDPSEHDSTRISAFERICKFIPEDPPQRGLVSVGGKVFSYSDEGVFGIDDPSVEVRMGVDCCCPMSGAGGDYLIVASGKSIYVLASTMFLLNKFDSPGDATKMLMTDNMCVMSLADGTIWQIPRNSLLKTNPAFTRVDVGFADDIATYGTYMATLCGSRLRFAKEQTLPKRLEKLVSQTVTGLEYLEAVDIVAIATSNGLSVADMTAAGYPETLVYEGQTYGCWTYRDYVYCFTAVGVDVYSVRREADAIITKFEYRMLPGKVVNGMCAFGDRLLFAAYDGLYASTISEKYEIVRHSSEDVSFCFEFTRAAGDQAFLCYDGENMYAFDSSTGQTIASYAMSGAEITGAVKSQVTSTIYIATSFGLYGYDINTPSFRLVESGDFVGIGSTRFGASASKRVFAACRTIVDNRIYVEDRIGEFGQLEVGPDIIDSTEQTVEKFCIISDSAQSPMLFIYLRNDVAQPGEPQYIIRCAELNGDGKIGRLLCSIASSAEYEKALPSRAGCVYLYASGTVSEFDPETSTVREAFDAQWIYAGSDNNVYRFDGTEYQRDDGGEWTTLLISWKDEYRGKVLCLACSNSSGYASISGTGVVKISKDPSAAVPVKTDFPNKVVTSIQNVFGMVLVSFNNMLYWSDVESIEELNYTSSYKSILAREQHFNGFFVAEAEGMVYAYGTNFVCTWPALDKQSFLMNAGDYTKLQVPSPRISRLIRHTSNRVDKYLGGYPYYGRPYVLSRDGGIYVYDVDNVGMATISSPLTQASKLFQDADGIAYQAQTGVMRTVNGKDSQQMYADGVKLSFQAQGILNDGRAYYYKVSGKWMYSVAGKPVEVPAGMQLDSVLRSNRTICVSDGKIYVVGYGKTRSIRGVQTGHEMSRYSVSRIQPTAVGLYYRVSDQSGCKVVGADYNTVQFRLGVGNTVGLFQECCFSDDGGYVYLKYGGYTYYCRVTATVAEKIRSQAVGFPHRAYIRDGRTSFDTSTCLAHFDRYGLVNVYNQVDRLNVKFKSLHKLGPGDYVICSEEGLYRYVQDFIYKLSYDTDPALAFQTDSFTGKTEYSAAIGSGIVRGSDLVNWSRLFSIGAGQYAVRGLYVKSAKDYYVATASGVYKTVYSYELVNDIEQRDEYELQSVVDSLQDDLDATFEKQLEAHVQEMHSPGSDLTFINSMLLSTDLAGIADGWQAVSEGSELVIDNDIVQTMSFGDLSAVGCAVDISNPVFSVPNAAADYILKKYMSGVYELYIHIPTTYTYYLNGVPGSACPDQDPAVSRIRKNLTNNTGVEISAKSQNSIPAQHVTEITITIPSTAMSITDVHDVQICPSSLPLKVYAENIDANDLERNQLYNSVIIPSVVRSYSTGTSGATFRFCCFGSDEQSVRIQFTGSANTAGSVIVTFDSNGGTGSVPAQVFSIGSAQRLRTNGFSNTGMSFIGWAYNRLPAGSTPTYANMQPVTFSADKYKDGDTATLYAVWISQEQEREIINNMNQFGISSDGSPVYIKSASEIEPGKTVIMYGD